MNDNKKFKDEILKLMDEGHEEAMMKFAGEYWRRIHQEMYRRNLLITVASSGIALLSCPLLVKAIYSKFPVKFSVSDLDF